LPIGNPGGHERQERLGDDGPIGPVMDVHVVPASGSL
jgi:hypothetical protein